MRKTTLVSLFFIGMLLFSTQAFAVEFKFWADEDSYITAAAAFADSNYGDLTFLRVRDLDTATYPDYLSRTLVKFSDADLTTLSGWDILDASLHLYEYKRTASSTDDGIKLYAAASSWAEGTVTWTTQPTYGATDVASRLFDADDTTPGWRSWQGSSFDELVAVWVADDSTNYGLMLEDDLDGDYNEMNVEFRSSEYRDGTSIYRPYLKITATPEPFSAVLFGIGGGLLGIFGARNRKRG